MFFALYGSEISAQSLNELLYDEGCFFKIISLSPRRVAVVHPPSGDPSFVHYSGVIKVPDTVYYGTRPFQVYAVADSAFFNCSSLTKVELPATLRTIGVNAFSGTTSLDTIRCYGEIPPTMYYDIINSQSSMGNMTPGVDYNRWRGIQDTLVLRVPCAGVDNYTATEGWSIFRYITGENMRMLYKDSICNGDNYYNHQFTLNRPSSGIYQMTNLSGGVTGCTYDAELHLVVHPTYRNNFSYYFCDEESLSYNAHGFHINNWTGGEHTWTNECLSVYGCDSISQLQFRHMLSVNDFYDSVCVGATYSRIFNGTLRFDLLAFETQVPDTDIVILKNFTPIGDDETDYQVGCSQTITAHIHVNPITCDTLEVNSCEGYPYTWNRSGYNAARRTISHSNTYHTSGFYSDTMFNSKGCLLYKNLDLHIWPPSDTVLYDTICGNEKALFGNSLISTEGVHTAKYPNLHSCDSNVALHLTVRNSYSDQQPNYTQVPIYHTDFNRDEDRFAWIFSNGTNGWRIKDGYLRVSSSQSSNYYNTSQLSDSYAYITYNTGDYDSIRIEMPTIVGGESFVDYLKVFLPGSSSSITYFNTNFTYAETYKNNHHNHVDTLTLYWHNNSNGVGNQQAVRINDITITGISHQLRAQDATHLQADICEGNSYHEGSFSYNTTGHYSHTYSTNYGCDSMVNLDLTVHKLHDTTFVRELCNGGQIVFDGTTYTQTSFITNNYEDQWGCDSIRKLDLTVWPTPTTTIDTVHIGDDPIVFGGLSITKDSTYTFVYSTVHGCDSTVILNVTIHHNKTTVLNASICDGETYNANGFNVSEQGVYYDTLSTIYGADSIVKLNLVVHPTYDKHLYADICDGSSFTFNSHIMTTTGSVTDHLSSIYGCDSLVTQHLQVHPTFSNTLDTTIYGDDPYIFQGITITESGTYTKLYTSQYGCDSLFTINITIHHNDDTVIYASICHGEVYNDNGFNENAAGTYTRHTSTISGADSTIILILTVNPVYDDTLDIAICDRTSYIFGGNEYSVAGLYTDSLHTYRLCDSVVTLHLTVNPVFDTVVFDTVRGDEGYWFYGSHLDSTGIYRDTMPNRYACDSITELHLQIYPTKTEHIFDTICQGQTYTLHDFNENSTGTFYRYGMFTVVGHSDSTAVLHLTVNPVYDDTIDITICDRTSYLFGGNEYSVAGLYTDSLHTYRMCDSVVTLHLTVNPVYEIVVYDTVRGDEGYWFLDTHLDSTGIYCDTLPTQQGCDSIIFLHLQIYNTATTHIFDTICDGQTYNNHGFSGQTVAGTYQLNLLTYGGADSTVFLHLWVNPVYDDTLVHHICDRTTYYGFGNHQLSVAGYYTDSLHTYRMCDSVVTLHLIVDPVYEVHVYDTVRGDDGYWFLGTHLDTTGVYCDTLPTQQGCDSIIFLHLKVYNNAYTTLFDTICDRNVYEGHGFSGQTTAGIYVDSLFTYGGADSIVTLHLWVNPVYEVHEYDTICSNRFLIHHNDTLRVAGNYTDTLPTIHGCDSIITMHLFVLPSYSDTFYAEICQGGSYSFHIDEPLTDEGMYRYFMHAVNECDSIETLFLTVHPTYNYIIEDSILPTENYTFGNHIIYDPGFYTDSLTSQYGCDSIVNLQLSNWYLHTCRLHDTICDGDSVFFNNNWCKRDSVYTDTLMADDGMDSLVVLFLKVSPVYNDTIFDSIFCTQFCVFGEDTLNIEGIYTHHLTSSRGCDSTVTLNLYVHTTRDIDSTVCMDRLPLLWNGIIFRDTIVTSPITYLDTAIVWNDSAQRNIMLAMHVTVVPNPIQTIADTIVENQLPYSFRGHIYNGNVENDTLLLPATEGCDTTTYYSLYYYPNVANTADTTICYGQLPIEWNGISFDAPEGVLDITHTATLIAHTGADSILTMNVHVLQNTYTTRHDTVVENLLPYEVHGHIYFGPRNLDTLIIPNSVGCDSVIFFRLIVNGNSVTMIDTTLCDYLLPINWNGHNFDDDGSTDLLSDTTVYLNQLGADSMVIMRVHILRCSSQVFDSTVCSALLPLRWNGRTFNLPQDMPTTLVDTIHLYTPTGADSLIILRLHVNESFNQTFYDTTCSNHPYLFLGEQYTSSCTLNASLQTHSGCDSIVKVHLKVWPTKSNMFEDIICPGTAYNWIDGNTYIEPTLGPFSTLRTTHGCDSIVYLHLVEGEPASANIWSNKSWIKVDDPEVRLADHTLHGESRIWHFPDSTSSLENVNYTYPIDYDSVRIYLIATNHDGCIDTSSLLLRLDKDIIWIPNVFTPSLTENNRFSIVGDGLVNVKVTIYNRDGLFIYSWEGLDGYWDGTHNGEPCPQSTYTYKVNYSTVRLPHDNKTKVGSVILLR